MGLSERFRLSRSNTLNKLTKFALQRQRIIRSENFTSITCRVHPKDSKVKWNFKKSQIHQKINLYKFYLFDKKVLRPTYSMLFSFLCRISPPRKAVFLPLKSAGPVSPAGRPMSKQLRLECLENFGKFKSRNLRAWSLNANLRGNSKSREEVEIAF